jgi:hypothetical protein
MAALVKICPGFTVPEHSLYQRAGSEYLSPLAIVMVQVIR